MSDIKQIGWRTYLWIHKNVWTFMDAMLFPAKILYNTMGIFFQNTKWDKVELLFYEIPIFNRSKIPQEQLLSMSFRIQRRFFFEYILIINLDLDFSPPQRKYFLWENGVTHWPQSLVNSVHNHKTLCSRSCLMHVRLKIKRGSYRRSNTGLVS